MTIFKRRAISSNDKGTVNNPVGKPQHAPCQSPRHCPRLSSPHSVSLAIPDFFSCHIFLCFFSQTQILATLEFARLLCKEKCSPMFYTWQGNRLSQSSFCLHIVPTSSHDAKRAETKLFSTLLKALCYYLILQDLLFHQIV